MTTLTQKAAIVVLRCCLFSATVFVATSFGARAAWAQSTTSIAPSKQATATVALVDELPIGFRHYEAVVVRRSAGSDRDVILLPRRTASPALLDAAARTLVHMQAVQGRDSSRYLGSAYREMILGIARPASPTTQWRARHSDALEELFTELRNEPARPVLGFGIVPAIEFYLPRPLSVDR